MLLLLLLDVDVVDVPDVVVVDADVNVDVKTKMVCVCVLRSLLPSLQTFFWLCGVGLPVLSGGIVAAGAAAYLHPAVHWCTTGSREEGQHRGGQPPLSSQ